MGFLVRVLVDRLEAISRSRTTVDTDDLTDLAYNIILSAADVSDMLRVELGAMASQFAAEDDWLHGIRAYLREVADDADDYVDVNSLEEFEGVTPAMIRRGATELGRLADDVLATPLDQRGASPF
jgi:hypothetical protein